MPALAEVDNLELLDLFSNPLSKQNAKLEENLTMLLDLISQKKSLKSVWLNNTGVTVT